MGGRSGSSLYSGIGGGSDRRNGNAGIVELEVSSLPGGRGNV